MLWSLLLSSSNSQQLSQSSKNQNFNNQSQKSFQQASQPWQNCSFEQTIAHPKTGRTKCRPGLNEANKWSTCMPQSCNVPPLQSLASTLPEKKFTRRFYFQTTNQLTISGLAPSTDIREGAETRILSLFPASSRTFIQPGVQAVQRAMDRNHNSAKVARTIRSRRIHYFIFCHTLKLDDDWTLANQPQERANYQLALYATHLATGSSLHCKSLKASTIASYLLDVAKFLGRYRDVDPRFRSTADTRLAPAIAKVLDEQKRWESVPNRREPFTLEMHKYIAHKATTQADDCCLDAALANWTLCNVYTGCRGIEWMQTDSKRQQLHSHYLNRFGNSYSFNRQDVQCSTASIQMLTIQEALQNPNEVGCIRLRFEGQKNGENGEKKLFVRNPENQAICFVHNFMCILARHAKLTKAHPTLPLSVYRQSDDRICNITSADVETCIRDAAAKLFNFDPVANRTELQMWSSHSLRVGACTTLYAMGFSEMEIKHLLRWKSNAFMTYLRDLAITSQRHNEAMSDATLIPNFL
jgi:hypothetical protein